MHNTTPHDSKKLTFPATSTLLETSLLSHSCSLLFPFTKEKKTYNYEINLNPLQTHSHLLVHVCPPRLYYSAVAQRYSAALSIISVRGAHLYGCRDITHARDLQCVPQTNRYNPRARRPNFDKLR